MQTTSGDKPVYYAMPASPPALTDLQRQDYENEYRAAMQRIAWLRWVLGK